MPDGFTGDQRKWAGGKKKEMTAAVGNYYTDNRIGLNFLEFVGSTWQFGNHA